MTIAFDAATNNTRAGTTNPYSFNHTPVGTPRGVILVAAHQVSTADYLGAATYGGVSMAKVANHPNFNKGVGETGGCNGWWLGAGIPTGTQAVSIVDGQGPTDAEFLCVTVTAAGDCDLAAVASNTGTGTNAAVSVAGGAAAWYAAAATHSARNGPADLSGNGMTAVGSGVDYGSMSSKVFRANANNTGTVSLGSTLSISDVWATIVVALTEIPAAATWKSQAIIIT